MRFTLPRDVYHGKGALEALKSFKGKKAMIVVGGGSMKRFGFLQKAEAYLKEAGMEVELFENVEPDPSVETVMKGADAMLKFQPDWIVAIGGGSPIDAAKAMWIKYEYPDCTLKICVRYSVFPNSERKLTSALFLLHPVQLLKLPHSQSSQTTTRVSSILSLTSRSLPMLLSLIPILQKQCLRSS